MSEEIMKSGKKPKTEVQTQKKDVSEAVAAAQEKVVEARNAAQAKAAEAKAAAEAQAQAEAKAAEAKATAEALTEEGKAAEAKAAAKAQIAAEKEAADAKAMADAKAEEAKAAADSQAAAEKKLADVRSVADGTSTGPCFYFYDGDTNQILNPSSAALDFQAGGGDPTRLSLKEKKGRFYIQKDDWTNWFNQLSQKGNQSEFEVQVTAAEFEISCVHYVTPAIMIRVTETSGECCCLPIPAFKLRETCTIRFHAHDLNTIDLIENAEKFLDGVELKITAVDTPAVQGTTASPTTLRSRTFSATTFRGCAEITGLAHSQLYEVELVAPRGYVLNTPIAPYIYICCETVLVIEAGFEPCGSCLTRSIVFSLDECNGKRWVPNRKVQVGDFQLDVDVNGVCNLTGPTSGQAEIRFLGKRFSPPVLNLDDKNTTVYTVSVADQAIKTLGSARHRVRFEDEFGEPFIHRPVMLVNHKGETKIVHTDHTGHFDGEDGWTAYADAHGLFPAVAEPLLLASKSEENL